MSNSSGTNSKTSDIGVGTAEVIRRPNNDLPNELLSTPQNNDTITVLSSISESSLQDRNQSFRQNREDTTDNIPVKETENVFAIKSHTEDATIAMDNKEFLAEKMTTSINVMSDPNEDNIAMKELNNFESPTTRTHFSPTHNIGANNISNNLINEYSGARNQVSKDNHTNDAFIYEEKQ